MHSVLSPVTGLERITTGLVAKRLTLSRLTSKRYHSWITLNQPYVQIRSYRFIEY